MSSKQLMGLKEWIQTEKKLEKAREWVKYLPSPSTLNEVFYVSTASFDDALHRYMLENLQLQEENLKAKKYLCGREFVISGDYIPFEWLKGNPNLGLSQPYCKIELNNEKEKEKMEAKKCERCGKLYEMQDVENYITAYFPGLSVSDYSKENFSESRIRKDNTRIVSVNFRGGQVIDLCPECREKLKNFFESGKDDPVDVAVREINNVIKKAEE